MPISTVQHPVQGGRTVAPHRRPTTIGMVSTYPPTQCGLATFSAALIEHLHLSSGSLGVVPYGTGTVVGAVARSAWCRWSTSPSRGSAATWWRSW